MKNLILNKAVMQVFENQGIVFGNHVKKIISKDNFQIFDKRKGQYVPANQFRTDVPLKNYEGYVLN